MNKLTWVKSSYSSGSGDNCVEVAALPDGGHAVRDSKDPEGLALRFTADEWRVFIRSVKAGVLVTDVGSPDDLAIPGLG